MWTGAVSEIRMLFHPETILQTISRGAFDVTPADPSLCDQCEVRRACRILPVLAEETPEEP